MNARGIEGTTHECQACGYQVLLGPGHHSDNAVCTSCGTDFVVEYARNPQILGGPYDHFEFAHCTAETPGKLIWSNSEKLKFDDRDNPIEIRNDVLPLSGTDLPDLSIDDCPKCRTRGSLVLRLPDEVPCPRCHHGTLKKVGTWIQ